MAEQNNSFRGTYSSLPWLRCDHHLWNQSSAVGCCAVSRVLFFLALIGHRLCSGWNENAFLHFSGDARDGRHDYFTAHHRRVVGASLNSFFPSAAILSATPEWKGPCVKDASFSNQEYWNDGKTLLDTSIGSGDEPDCRLGSLEWAQLAFPTLCLCCYR